MRLETRGPLFRVLPRDARKLFQQVRGSDLRVSSSFLGDEHDPRLKIPLGRLETGLKNVSEWPENTPEGGISQTVSRPYFGLFGPLL